MDGARHGSRTQGRAPGRWQRLSAGVRAAWVGVPGVLVGAAVGWWASPVVGVVTGWDVASAAFLAWTWRTIASFDCDRTREVATHEDPSRGTADLVMTAASLAALGAVGVLVAGSSSGSGPGVIVEAALAIVSVALSWGVVHTLYTLRYASAYYAEPVGGIGFNTEDEEPCYVDFAYVAFTVGMTYQISDTDLESRDLRRLVLKHMFVSYVLGAVVLASAIQVVAGLAK